MASTSARPRRRGARGSDSPRRVARHGRARYLLPDKPGPPGAARLDPHKLPRAPQAQFHSHTTHARARLPHYRHSQRAHWWYNDGAGLLLLRHRRRGAPQQWAGRRPELLPWRCRQGGGVARVVRRARRGAREAHLVPREHPSAVARRQVGYSDTLRPCMPKYAAIDS